jgi:hypothetical protein
MSIRQSNVAMTERLMVSLEAWPPISQALLSFFLCAPADQSKTIESPQMHLGIRYQRAMARTIVLPVASAPTQKGEPLCYLPKRHIQPLLNETTDRMRSAFG